MINMLMKLILPNNNIHHALLIEQGKLESSSQSMIPFGEIFTNVKRDTKIYGIYIHASNNNKSYIWMTDNE